MIWCLLMLSWSWGFGNVYHDQATLQKVWPMGVEIRGSAAGGCWINISEARSYAFDQLELAGAELVRDGTPRNAGAGNILEIYVFAERWDNLCHRYIAVSIGNWAMEKNNIFGYLEYYRHQ